MAKKILIRIVVAFIAALSIGYILSQGPIHLTAALALEQQQSLSNPTDIVVAHTIQEKVNLELFDNVTFEGINNNNKTALKEIHTPDVLAVGFGENVTRGIEPHLDDVENINGTKIIAHPIKIAAGNWTIVTGQTDSNISMVTVARWEDNRIAEEYAFISEANLLDPVILGQ
jgi:hypothetical protein